MDQISPSEHVLAKCGGALVVARWLGLHPPTVYKWTYSQDKGGTGGFIPARWHQSIMDHARANGVDLRPEHFFRSEQGAAA